MPRDQHRREALRIKEHKSLNVYEPFRADRKPPRPRSVSRRSQARAFLCHVAKSGVPLVVTLNEGKYIYDGNWHDTNFITPPISVLAQLTTFVEQEQEHWVQVHAEAVAAHEPP